MKKYIDLTQQQQAELLELEIKKQLGLAVYLLFAPQDFINEYDNLSQYPRDAIPYILHHTSEKFRQEINKMAINELQKKQYLPVERNNNLTIIYIDGE
jgi:hypothetical protein